MTMQYDLSPIELSFWYQYKFDSASDANNIVHRLIVAKQIDGQSLKTALARIVHKHPILRSRFREEDGVPYRTVFENLDLDLIDGTSMSDEAVLKKMQQPFMLDRDSLLRVVFINDEDDTTLFVACPHIIFDAMSWNIFLNDLSKALGSDFDDTPYHLEYPKVDPQAQQYWKSKLENVEGRVDFEQSGVQKPHDGNLGTVVLPDEESLIKKLIELGKAERVSINSLCMAVLSVALSKMTGSDDMIIATPVTTRDADSVDRIGSYINVLPAVMKVDKSSSFLKYARIESQKIWDDIDNRSLSLIELMRDVYSQAHGDDQGIYNVMAEYVPFSPIDDMVRDDKIVPNKYAKMDLILSVVADARSHAINLEYDASKFDQNYMSAVAKVFLNITKSIVENAHQPIKDIPLIDTDETKDLLAIGSGETKKIAPPFVWNRFKMTARNNFESTAIKDKSKSITYKELFEMSCRYAELLAERGVTTSSVVGVHMERSADYIASMLAIWSLGAVYVPLDTKQPTSRITYMIKQAGISAVVTRRNNKNIDSDIMRCDIEDSVDMKPRNSSYEPTGEDMAYVIFTSGSTGTPKGVMIEHRGFLNHLEIMIEDLNLSKNDVIAQTAPVSFDISVWQLICALMVGASIVIVDHGDLIDPDQMHQIIKKDGISVLEVVPSLLSGYLSAEESNSRLRGQFEYVKVITTGEAISGSIVEQWITHYPNQPLLNAYGPAEASDDTHFFDIQGSAVDSARSIPIGRSLLNIQTYVVNQDMQLLPKGVVGEICIGGLAVAKGYIGSEELTAKSFLPNPFSEKEQSRLYRTGDYGKWREDNLLEYHGRRDHQVKVRGQRLELGEVEERLKKVSGVKDAAVIAERSPSGARLRGYIVSHHPDVSTEGVKTQLGLMLPDYMVPWKIEIIPSLPRTGNGKLDRRTLEAYSNTNNDSSLSNKASESLSKLLQQIVQVYSSVLNTDIKHNSNYFDFGGDSLLSMKIVAMLEKKNIHVGIRDILMHQTPEELALSVSKKQDAKLLGAESWPILDGLTPIQDYYLENTGKKYRDNGDVQAAILTVGYETDLDDGSLLSALNKIMNIHEELRPIEESTPLVVQSNAIQAKKQDTAVLVDEMRIKVSLRNPLVGCVLSEAGKKSVLLVAHHYVLDFYSWSLIEEELKAFLEGGTKTIKENVLKKWWGKTLSDLTNDKSKLDDAIRFWQPAHDQLHNMETVDGDTKHFTYSHSLPESIVKGLSKEGVSLESFSYFAIIKAQLATSGKVSFSYNIESSIRSIDDTGVLGKGVGWMTYLFPQKFEEGSLSTISLGDFHKMNVDAIRRGYEYGLLRYKILPKQFKDRSVPIWTMNYLGKSMEHTGDVTILQSRPMKEGPFIEVDISHDDEQITFQYFHNTALSKDDFDAMDEELSTVIKGLASQTMQKKMTLSAQRQKAILERLKHAG